MSDETQRGAGFLYGVAMNVWLGPSLWTAVQFKLADRIAKQPATADELARDIGADSDRLQRLLNALASVGVFARDENGRFSLTAISDVMRSDHPQSLAGLIDTSLGGENQAAWQFLADAVRSGDTAFDLCHGTDWITYYERNPERRRVFASAMTSTTRANEETVLATHDFGNFNLAVDIGGSAASFIGRLLEKYSNAQGIVFDLPATVESGRSVWADKSFANRLKAVGGDFFKSVPAGDLYLLKLILHDWKDAEAIAILKNIRRAIQPGGRVAIVESVVPEELVPSLGRALDISMMAITGGRERTMLEYKKLLEESGFSVTRYTPTASAYSVIEAQPV